MVDQVTFDQTSYNILPFKFEAGTSNYIGAIGLAKALEYLQNIGFEAIGRYEKELSDYSLDKLGDIQELRLYGNAAERISVFSFLLDHIHTYDAGMILDKMGSRSWIITGLREP
jgi:cysteine desulfurase/selenocysteine lyase